MTEKVFWQDPYLSELDTEIAGVDGDEVWLRRSIFFAESGGQESDSGSIGRRRVRSARKQGREILYRLDPAHGLRPGEAVRVRIDWPRRYRLMRLHFAAEIVLELAYRAWPGIEKIGAHIGADKARIDFSWPHALGAALPELARQAQAIVDADHAIESAFSDTAAERRFWKIPEFARVPCAGTHLRHTGEIGRIAPQPRTAQGAHRGGAGLSGAGVLTPRR